MALQRIDGGLEVVYGQRDYGGTRLGLCDGTDRGLYGCYLTSVAMMLRHYGYNIDPAGLDDLLTMGPNGNAADPGSWSPIYVNGCDMVDDAAERVTGGEMQVVSVEDFSGVPADLSTFSMADDEEIIVGIDATAAFGYPTHFLRVYSWDGTTMVVVDPWQKARLDLEAVYGAPYGLSLEQLIIKNVKHRLPGWVPPWKNQPAPPAPVPEPAQPQQVSDSPPAGTTVTVIFQGRVFQPDAQFFDKPDGSPVGQPAPIGDLVFWQGAFDGVNWWDRVSSDGGAHGDWWVLDSKVDTGGHTPAYFYNQTQLPLTNLPAAPYPLTPNPALALKRPHRRKAAAHH